MDSLCITCQKCYKVEVYCEHSSFKDGNKTLWQQRKECYYAKDCPIVHPKLIIDKVIKECPYYKAKPNLELVLAQYKARIIREHASLDYCQAIELPSAHYCQQIKPYRQNLTDKLHLLYKQVQKAREEYEQAIAPFTKEYKQTIKPAESIKRNIWKQTRDILRSKNHPIKKVKEKQLVMPFE